MLGRTRSPEESTLLGSGADINDVINPTRSFTYIMFLTMIIGGLQLSWCTEFSNGTPFLLSLGMSKTLMSLVWIAGPLSGALGQPVVGVISDESRWKYGRRRPLIIIGATATIVSLLCLSWSEDIVALINPIDISEELLRARTIPFAVMFVYLLDFSISVIQASSRAFMVDNVPTHQQQTANASAAVMTGVGNIAGYFLGSINLPRAVPWLGNTQFKVLSACACIALVVTVGPAVLYVKERDPNTDPTIVSPTVDPTTTHQHKLRRIYKDTLRAIAHLSPQTRLICNVQFFAWIGYFPMLFYTTTYVGDMYRREILGSRPPDVPPMDQHEWDALQEESTRRGAAALVAYSITSLIANVVLPYVVNQTYYRTHHMLETDREEVETKQASGLEQWLGIRGVSVARVWTWSHGLFALCMASTFWIKSADGATVLVGVLGVVWAVSHWAPFTIISEEISRIKEKKARAQVLGTTGDHHKYHNYEHEAGVVLGVHNVFIAAPQVISSLLSSLIFMVFAGDESDSIGWVFRFGGVFALVAMYLSWYVKEPQQLDLEDEMNEG
jgi:solute carrier family 45 protein 1/2/4